METDVSVQKPSCQLAKGRPTTATTDRNTLHTPSAHVGVQEPIGFGGSPQNTFLPLEKSITYHFVRCMNPRKSNECHSTQNDFDANNLWKIIYLNDYIHLFSL